MTALDRVRRRRAGLRHDIGINREQAGLASADIRVQLRAAMFGASIGRLLAGLAARSRWRALAGVSLGVAAAVAAGRLLSRSSPQVRR